MKNIDELQLELKEIQSELESLFIKRDKLDNEIIKLRKKEKKIEEQIEQIEINNEDLNWEYLLFSDYKGSKQRTNEFNKRIGNISKSIVSDGLYNSKLNQRILEICVAETTDKNKLKEAIIELLPYIKPFEDNKVFFHIREPSLSEHGIYELWIDKNTKKCNVSKRVYGSCRDVLINKNIDEVLNYIEKNLKYEYEINFSK
jgi:chromosome segregation ATPase